MSSAKIASAYQEIEVTYVPKYVPDALLQATPTRIIDRYLSPADDPRVKLRLRQTGKTYELTKKISNNLHDLSVQDEYTIPLTPDEFALFSRLDAREVIKDRYKSALGNKTIEIDVFRGKLEGLVLIEVEFISEAERNAFIPPDYFGNDVTQELFVAGTFLAGKSYADIEQFIAKFT